jgi:hypothetical protein
MGAGPLTDHAARRQAAPVDLAILRPSSTAKIHFKLSLRHTCFFFVTGLCHIA